MDSAFFSLLPIIIVQIAYAVFAGQIAKRTHHNVTLYVIVTLIPLVGAFFFIYVIWSTVLYVLDSLNELKGK